MTTLIPKFDLKNGESTPTGAINRAINEKLAEMVSVTDFGADPTGISNSTTAFANAIASSASVYIPLGTYLLDTIVIPALEHGVTITGASRDGVVLKATASTTNFIQLGTTRFTYGNCLKNFTIDFADAPNTSSSHALNLQYTYSNLLENIQVINITSTQIGLYVNDGVYTTNFTNIDFGNSGPITAIQTGIVKIQGTIADQPTTLCFINCMMAQVIADQFLTCSFYNPVIQGPLTTKVILSNCFGFTIIGGDIEHSGAGATYLYLGANAVHVTSISNELTGITYSYFGQTNFSSTTLMDYGGDGFLLYPANDSFKVNGMNIGLGGNGNTGNIAIGNNALVSNVNGTNNTSAGTNSLQFNVNGIENTAFGNNCGSALVSGNNNSLFGYAATASTTSVNNEITLGNSSIATLRCQVTSITSLSDGRDKTNVSSLLAGLAFVNKLKPVSFDWNMRDGGKVGITDIGFIAQDLQQAQIDTKIEIPGLVYESNPDSLEAAYGKLIPVLVKAIQELKVEVDLLKPIA